MLRSIKYTQHHPCSLDPQHQGLSLKSCLTSSLFLGRSPQSCKSSQKTYSNHTQILLGILIIATNSPIRSYYRKYRSLRTPPTLAFQAQLLHNQEGVIAEKGGFRKISSRAFLRLIVWCPHSLGCEAIEPGMSVLGVCQDSDTYGTQQALAISRTPFRQNIVLSRRVF